MVGSQKGIIKEIGNDGDNFTSASHKANSQNVISVSHLNKSFPYGFFNKLKPVLHDVSFSVPKGTATGFVGNNGSGKTTSIKSILQFIRPDSGEILFFGKPLDMSSRAQIGYLPERPYLYEFLTGQEFLRLHWNLNGGGREADFIQRATVVLKKMDLLHAKDKRLRQYSKGMLQRVGLAQAILCRPELLILDEPMSGLDPDGRAIVKSILQEELQRGASIFFSSHLLQDMEEICTHLVIINHGVIIYNGELLPFIAKFKNLEEAFKESKLGEVKKT